MILVDEIFVAKRILLTDFTCRLDLCRGDCCRIGGRGAPLTREEAEFLEEMPLAVQLNLPITEQARNFLRDGVSSVERERGKAWTRMLLGDLQGFCVYSRLQGEIITCALETVREQLPFPKPLSCHLFPLREQTFLGRRYFVFESREECAPAFGHGTPLLELVKEALIRATSAEFYEKLHEKMETLREKIRRG